MEKVSLCPVYMDDFEVREELSGVLATEDLRPVSWIIYEARGRFVQRVYISGKLYFLTRVMSSGCKSRPAILLTRTNLKPGDYVAYRQKSDGSYEMIKLKPQWNMTDGEKQAVEEVSTKEYEAVLGAHDHPDTRRELIEQQKKDSRDFYRYNGKLVEEWEKRETYTSRKSTVN